MFAGKTTELMRRLKKYLISGKRCVVLKHRSDRRYSSSCVVTHDKAQMPAVEVANLSEFAGDHQVIGIDEGQFFDDLVPFAESMANAGRVVIVAALDSTFQRCAFQSVVQLVPLAEKVTKLKAICLNCGENASFSHRTSQQKEVCVVGGSESYKAVCRSCYFELNP